jgi:hypothetical protein
MIDEVAQWDGFKSPPTRYISAAIKNPLNFQTILSAAKLPLDPVPYHKD